MLLAVLGEGESKVSYRIAQILRFEVEGIVSCRAGRNFDWNATRTIELSETTRFKIVNLCIGLGIRNDSLSTCIGKKT